ncbi:MAG: DUF4332 domain-containing protein [Alphaproteobacteria bacterium]|nr:DUF4332 domain-containing protein [Alphaproteobacteria bacterium]
MTLAFQILRASHASGTHHKLALDALLRLTAPDSKRWQRVFLKHTQLYVEGAKAPDKEFKDFKNHVLHPGDDYWGGAPEKARNWYGHLLEALRNEDWSQAAYCAGVLSHYYTDPVQPFHTGQSDAESDIHGATEWSISKSYESLIRETAGRDSAQQAPPPSTGEQWLQDYVCLAAETSHAHYERLIAHYDFKIGVVTPQEGLDPVARNLVGDLLIFAQSGLAHILDRAIIEAGVEPPNVNLTPESVLGTLKIPLRWVLNRIEDKQTRRQVEAMYDELMATGRVDKTLPEDDRQIRDLHAREVVANRKANQTAERAKRVSSGGDKANRQTLSKIWETARVPNPPARSAPHQEPTQDSSAPLAQLQTERPTPPAPTNIAPAIANRVADRSTNRDPARATRYYLNASDDMEAAPSIGAKTAARLEKIGLTKVSHLLDADPADVATRLGHSRITAVDVTRWQDESRLMMSIAGLRVTQSQMLVGAGYRYTIDIAEAKPEELSAALLAFAATQSGKRLLREGTPPDIEKIKLWIDEAHLAAA